MKVGFFFSSVFLWIVKMVGTCYNLLDLGAIIQFVFSHLLIYEKFQKGVHLVKLVYQFVCML